MPHEDQEAAADPPVTTLGTAAPATSYRTFAVVGDRLYAVTGSVEPTRFVAVDLDTREVAATAELPAGSGAWAVIDLDGSVYVGSSGEAILYRYDPGSSSLDRLVDLPGADVICDLAVRDGRVLAGTFPDGNLHEYDPARGTLRSRDLAPAGCRYVRNVVATPDAVYAGTATEMHVLEHDVDTGATRDITPTELGDESSTRTMAVADDHLLVGTRPGYRLAVVPLDDPFDFRIVDPGGEVTNLGVDAGTAYLAVAADGDRALYSYDVDDGELRRLAGLGHEAIDVGLAVRDGAVVGLSPDGTLWRHDVATGAESSIDLSAAGVPPCAAVPRALGCLEGVPVIAGRRKLHLHADDHRQVPSSATAKAMAAADGALHVAMYTDAVIGVYEHGDGEVADLARLGHDQNRPRAACYHEPSDLVFVGTKPEYGQLGGAVAWFPPRSADVRVEREPIPDQSVRALAPAGEHVLLGTEIYGEKVDPVAAEARVAGWDPRAEAVAWELVPVPGAAAIADLATVGERAVGLTEGGELFAIDTATGGVTGRTTAAAGGSFDLPGPQLAAAGGEVYCATGDALLAVDPDSLSVRRAVDGLDPANPLVVSDDRDTATDESTLSFVDGYDLCRVETAALDGTGA